MEYLFYFLIDDKKDVSMRVSFKKMDNQICQPTYKHYGTKREAFFTCRSDPNCKFVLDKDCTHPNDNGHVFFLCGKNSKISISNLSCIYDKRLGSMHLTIYLLYKR